MSLIVQLCAIAAFLVGTAVVPRSWRYLIAWLRARSTQHALGDTLFLYSSIREAIRYYLEPWCEVIETPEAGDPHGQTSVRRKLFETLDDLLFGRPENRYLIILADSGMGKTSALINYYLRRSRKWIKRFPVALAFLGSPDAEDKIKRIEQKGRTILLLDSLDEDVQAIADRTARLRDLLEASSEFLRVIITSRTQFFASEGEVPKKTGILRVGSRRAGEPGEYIFRQVYLCPLSAGQVRRYIQRRFPIWRPAKRRAAQDLVSKMPDLLARPMLLAHIEDIITTRAPLTYPFQVYQEMISAWLKREEGPLLTRTDVLRTFSQRLAVEIFRGRDVRGSERIASDEVSGRNPGPTVVAADALAAQTERVTQGDIASLATRLSVPLDQWQITGRSLLTRDRDGCYRFAHRSILECLFVEAFLAGDVECIRTDWTDLMIEFLAQELQRRVEQGLTPLLPQPLWEAEAQEADFKKLLGLALLNAPGAFPGFPNSKWVLTMAALVLARRNTDVTTFLHADNQRGRMTLNTCGPLGPELSYGRGKDTEILYSLHDRIVGHFLRSGNHPPLVLVGEGNIHTLGERGADYSTLVGEIRDALAAATEAGNDLPSALCAVPLARSATFFVASTDPHAFDLAFEQTFAAMVLIILFFYFASREPELYYPQRSEVGIAPLAVYH